MPSGVLSYSISNGAKNAGLAAKIIATSNPELLDKLKEFSRSKDEVEKNQKLEIGYEEYLKQMNK